MLFCSAGQFIKRGVLLFITTLAIFFAFDKAGIEWILPFLAWFLFMVLLIFLPTLVWIILGYTLKFIIEKILLIKTTQKEEIDRSAENSEKNEFDIRK